MWCRERFLEIFKTSTNGKVAYGLPKGQGVSVAAGGAKLPTEEQRSIWGSGCFNAMDTQG